MLISLTGSSTNDWKTRLMQEPDKEKLRAFEQKMHDEGADGFADGPRPWETWDESGAQAGAGKRVWEGKARRIYRNAPMRRSLGERILSGLAMVALATMVVGIAGVYFTEKQPQTVAWTTVQPTPIPFGKPWISRAAASGARDTTGAGHRGDRVPASIGCRQYNRNFRRIPRGGTGRR
jgi:hypothetical protein